MAYHLEWEHVGYPFLAVLVCRNRHELKTYRIIKPLFVNNDSYLVFYSGLHSC